MRSNSQAEHLGVGGWELEVGINRLPAELNCETGGRAVEAVAQDVGLRGLAVADAAAHADRLRDPRRDVCLRLEHEEVVSSNDACPEGLRLRRYWGARGGRRLDARIGDAEPDVARPGAR